MNAPGTGLPDTHQMFQPGERVARPIWARGTSVVVGYRRGVIVEVYTERQWSALYYLYGVQWDNEPQPQRGYFGSGLLREDSLGVLPPSIV